jgi:hypothetical protein
MTKEAVAGKTFKSRQFRKYWDSVGSSCLQNRRIGAAHCYPTACQRRHTDDTPAHTETEHSMDSIRNMNIHKGAETENSIYYYLRVANHETA